MVREVRRFAKGLSKKALALGILSGDLMSVLGDLRAGAATAQLDLMCARRESVCRALRTLRIYDLVRTPPDAGFILLGPSPDQVETLALHGGTMRARRQHLGAAVRKALAGVTRV